MKDLKSTILIIIDNFKKGGAEVLLVGILKDLNEKYNVILVTLSEENHFNEYDLAYFKRYNLGFTGKTTLLRSVKKLRAIIEKHKPSIVHAHLFYSNLIGRLACPKHIPFFFTVHNQLSRNTNTLEKIVEKMTVRNSDHFVGVSNMVANDYRNTIKKLSLSHVLPNYISSGFFLNGTALKNSQTFKLVAVGNIKPAKNYGYLIQAFCRLKNIPVSLDIYGTTTNKKLYNEYIKAINENNLPIRFLGQIDNPGSVLGKYDAFISSSSHEGFGMSVIEAMASGLPLLLSDIEVFREITNDNALFFDIHSVESLTDVIQKVINDTRQLSTLSDTGKIIAQNYTKEKYISKLFTMYDDSLKTK